MGELTGRLRRAARAAPVLAAGLLASSAVQARYAPGEIMVRFRPGIPSAAVDAAATGAGAVVRRAIPGMRLRLMKVPPGRGFDAVLARLRANPDVELAEPNLLYRKKALPNDPLLGWQWSLDRIGATLAWGMTIAGAPGSDQVLIAVIDDGIDSAHPDLAGKVAAGYDPVLGLPSGDPDPPPLNDHGTFVASIAAALTNDGTGMAGAGWNTRLLAVKISGTTATTWAAGEFDILNGIDWAVARGARVINMSLGSCSDDGFGNITCDPGTQIAADAIKDLWTKGVIVVAAAGNESTTMLSFPAAYPLVLGAAASDDLDRPTTFSNRGANVDVAAPGGSTTFILCDPNHDMLGCTNETTMASGGYPNGYCPALGFCPSNCHATGVGTSESAPLVAALAAVLIGRDPAASSGEIAGLIRSTADLLPPATGHTPEAGYGRINMYRALTLLPPPPAPGARLVVTLPVAAPPPPGSEPFCPPVGGEFTFSLPVRNTGTAPVTELTPSAVVTGAAGSLVLVSAPPWSATEVIPAGGSRTYTWSWRRAAAGTATVSTRIEGMDVLTGANVRAEWSESVCTTTPPAPAARPYAAPNPVAGNSFRLVVPLAAPAAAVRVEAWNAGMQRIWHGDWTNVGAGTAPLPVSGVSGWAPGHYLVRITVTSADGTQTTLDPVKVVVKR